MLQEEFDVDMCEPTRENGTASVMLQVVRLS